MEIKFVAFNGPIDLEVEDTGGGCQALNACMVDDIHVYIADEGNIPTKESKTVCVWVEDDDGNTRFQVQVVEGITFAYDAIMGKCENGVLSMTWG